MLIFAAVLTILVYGLMSPVLGVLLPTYTLTAQQQGQVGSANAIGLMIASLCAGPLVDIRGKKPALLVGLLLIFCALLAAPNALGFPSLLVIYFTLGIGGGTVVTAANSLVRDLSAAHHGSVLNFLNLFFGLGGIVTTFAASYFLSPVALCYCIAALVAVAATVDLAADIPKSSGKARFSLNEVPHLLSNPTLLLISLLLFLYVACEVTVWNWFKTYLLSIHFTVKTAGGVISYGFALGILVGRLIASRVLLRVSAAKLVLTSSACMTVTTYAMLQTSSHRTVTIVVFCAGLAMAPVFPTALSIVGDRFPQSSATAMGIVITSGWLGLAVSSPILGSLAAKTSLQQALLLLPVLAGAIVLVSMVLNTRLFKARRT